MIIDKKGKLFGKLNIIDLCVILVIIAAVAVAYIKYAKSKEINGTDSNVTIEYTLKVKGVRNYTADQFIEGDNIYDNETGKCIGTITKITKTKNKDYIVKSDGTNVLADKPDRYDIYVTAESGGTVNNSGYFAGGTRQIAPHSTVIVSNKRVKTNSFVTEVHKK